ncbi:hypothetical protein RRG08_004875 [Elysia crispata]|uniref:Uncharacterized protein n=1 Tax=Elysia crispata TaxID=231223 RepID=A0AAE1B6S3_9GAST|nr:hypothetical protein RRG08_004875 [Elysia crispata]
MMVKDQNDKIDANKQNKTTVHLDDAKSTNKNPSYTSKELNQTLSMTTLPHLFWMGIHAPGLLKSPHFESQSADEVLAV